jgi:hypothetical protein
MRHFHPLAGVAAVALTAVAVSACYPPDTPTVTELGLSPTAFPPSPPQAYVPPAAATPDSSGALSPRVAPYGPPAQRVETPPPLPAPMAVWQPGRWTWSGGQYVWVPGQYVRSPSPTANWVPGHWQQGTSGWFWVDGHWA